MNDASDRCYCGSGLSLTECCGRFIRGNALPQSAEELMRSRYTAYVLKDIAYLRDTLWPKHQAGFDVPSVRRWAENSLWMGLTVIRTSKGGSGDREGTVLFEARYMSDGRLETHRELGRFRKKAGRWYYVEALPLEPN